MVAPTVVTNTGKVPLIEDYLEQVVSTLRSLPVEQIAAVADAVAWAREAGRRVFVFGNGGSAATATHMACDLSKGTVLHGQPRVKAISLCDNLSLLSAWANDTAYEHVFAEQLENLIEEGDVAIGISGSGNSANVLNAIDLAKRRGATTIGFCGFDGGRLAQTADMTVVVRNRRMEQVEDIHLILEHVLTVLLRTPHGTSEADFERR